ncbi:MAG: hypothetical protein ACRDHP_04790, partial [Ktedonobacterales bacterium]
METPVIVDSSPVTSVHRTEGPSRIVRLRHSMRRLLIPYLFVLPFLVLFAAFFVAPLLYAFQQSLYK